MKKRQYFTEFNEQVRVLACLVGFNLFSGRSHAVES